MKLSCSAVSVSQTFKEKKMDVRGFLRFCVSQKIEGVDLLDSQSYPWFWGNPHDIGNATRWAEDAGLTIAAYACSNNFAKECDSEFDDQVDRVRQAIREARQAGAPLLRIFGGSAKAVGNERPIDFSRGMERVFQGIEACLQTAEESGIVLALENHGRLPGYSSEIAAILNHFNSPWLQVTFDAANFLGNSMTRVENPLDAYRRLKGRIAHVHIKDFGPAKIDLTRRVEPCLPGEGFTPLRELFAALENDQFPGLCSLEYEARLVMPELDGIAASFDYFKNMREASPLISPRGLAEKSNDLTDFDKPEEQVENQVGFVNGQ